MAIAVLLSACSSKVYLPEEHLLANALKTELIKYNYCTQNNCMNFVQTKSYAIRYKEYKKGSIDITVLNAQNEKMANYLLNVCKKARTQITEDVPVGIKIYQTSETNNTAPLVDAKCEKTA